MTARRLKANSYLCDDRISYTRIHPQWPFQVARQRPKVHVRIQLGAATILMWLKIRVGLAQRTRLEVSQSDRKSRIQRLIVAVKLDNDWALRGWCTKSRDYKTHSERRRPQTCFRAEQSNAANHNGSANSLTRHACLW